MAKHCRHLALVFMLFYTIYIHCFALYFIAYLTVIILCFYCFTHYIYLFNISILEPLRQRISHECNSTTGITIS